MTSNSDPTAEAALPAPVASAPVTREHVREFQARGFVLVEALLTQAELRHHAVAVDRAVAERMRGPGARYRFRLFIAATISSAALPGTT